MKPEFLERRVADDAKIMRKLNIYTAVVSCLLLGAGFVIGYYATIILFRVFMRGLYGN